MTRRHGLVWCVGLLLGFTLAVGYAAPGYDTPGLGTAQPALPSKDTEQREIIPLPTAGATEHFRYARERGGLYRITPSDGTPSYLVSEHFLRVTLANTDLDGFQQAEILRSYSTLVQEMFTNTMAQAYPVATTESAEPFATLTLDGTDGTSVVLEQDPVAAPYVRVRLRSGAGGEVVEFSVARSMVDHLLANNQLTDDQVLRGLQSFPFRLPEVARRGDFERLSAAELAALVQKEPALQQHEVIQMSRLYGTDAGTAVRSTETLLQQARPQAKPFPEATFRAAEPPGMKRRTALAQQPSPTLAMDRTGKQPPSNAGAIVHGTDGLSQQETASSGRFPVTKSAAPTTDALPIGVSPWVLYILASSLFAVGIIALVASLSRRKELGIRR
jgi:hypothetical protein